MAGDWIKMQHDLPEKPEVGELMHLLKLDEFAVVGRLHRLWSWFDRHTETGNANVTHTALLDALLKCDGFIAALQQVGWITVEEKSISLPNFERHNSKSAKSRALASLRVIRSRNAASVTNALPEKRREESTKRDISTNRYSVPIKNALALTTAPEWEVVRAHAEKIGLPEWRAKDWFDEMEGCGWLDHNGREIKKWEAVLNRVRTHWEGKGRPMKVGAAKDSPWNLKTVMQAKERESDQLKNKYSSQVATGTSWSNKEALAQYKKLRQEIKELNKKLAAVA